MALCISLLECRRPLDGCWRLINFFIFRDRRNGILEHRRKNLRDSEREWKGEEKRTMKLWCWKYNLTFFFVAKNEITMFKLINENVRQMKMFGIWFFSFVEILAKLSLQSLTVNHCGLCHFNRVMQLSLFELNSVCVMFRRLYIVKWGYCVNMISSNKT